MHTFHKHIDKDFKNQCHILASPFSSQEPIICSFRKSAKSFLGGG